MSNIVSDIELFTRHSDSLSGTRLASKNLRSAPERRPAYTVISYMAIICLQAAQLSHRFRSDLDLRTNREAGLDLLGMQIPPLLNAPKHGFHRNRKLAREVQRAQHEESSRNFLSSFVVFIFLLSGASVRQQEAVRTFFLKLNVGKQKNG